MNGSSSGGSEIIVKLFDTLKDSSDKTTEALNNLISQQNELISHVNHLPIDDLKQALRDRSDQAAKDVEKSSIDSKTILEKLRDMDKKLSKVLIAIAVAFSIIAAAYIIVRSTTDTNKIINTVVKRIDQDQDQKHDRIINEIKKEIEKFHKK
jgi:predicted PurR-regulated permease PerM